MKSTAKYIVEWLLLNNIDTFFGVIGGPVSPLFDAIMRTTGANLVEARHETSAAFEAIGYYHATGKIPVVVVTAGPGVTNSVTGLASAYLSRIPILLICGDVAWETTNKTLVQNSGPDGINADELLQTFSKNIQRVSKPSELKTKLLLLFKEITSAPGPICLIIPINVSRAMEAFDDAVVFNMDALDTIKSVYSVEQVTYELQIAKRPLFILGVGCKRSHEELTKFFDTYSIPFVTTPQAKGVVSETHPMSLGNIGIAASVWAREYTKICPDLTIVLGTDLDDVSLGNVQSIGPSTKLIHVDTNSKAFNRGFTTYFAIKQDIRVFMNELLTQNLEIGVCHVEKVNAAKSVSKFDVPNFQSDMSVPIAPHRILSDIQQAFPDARFVTDIGEHMIFCLHYLVIEKHDNFFIDLGLGSMGSGLCKAIGLAYGDRSRKVVCIVGDGCMQMVGMEIIVARKYKLPIVFVIFNDARYNIVYHGFKMLYGYEGASGETPMMDFCKFADALGIPSIRIEQPGEIDRHEIDKLQVNDLPIILDVRINKCITIKGSGRNEALQQMSVLTAEK